MRSGIANTALENSPVIAALLSNQKKHDVLAMHGMNFPGKFDETMSEMGAMVLINQTERDFVVPRNCYYCAPIVDDVMIVAPISPKVALSLSPATEHTEYENGFAVIRRSETIRRMNVYALKYEHMFNKAFIAASSSRELEELQKIRNEHLSGLEVLNTV